MTSLRPHGEALPKFYATSGPGRSPAGGIGLFLLVLVVAVLPGLGGPAIAGPVIVFNGMSSYENQWQSPEKYRNYENMQIDDQFSLSSAMSLKGSLRYSRNETGSVVSTLTENLQPTLSFLITNDIFHFNLTGTASESMNSESIDTSRRTLYATWRSAWQKRFWPSLGLSVNHSRQQDDSNPRTINLENSNLNFTSRLNLDPVDLYYSYSLAKDENLVRISEARSMTHFARLRAARQFWDDRLSVNLQQTATLNHRETRDIIISGTASVQFPAPTVNGGPDSNPTVTAAGALGLLPATTDPLQPIGIAITQSDLRNSNTIYLYTNGVDQTDNVANLTWDLYISNDLGGTWTLMTAGFVPVYNATLLRFEAVVAGVAGLEIKFIVRQNAVLLPPIPAAVTFSRVEVFRDIAGTGSFLEQARDTDFYKTDVSVSARPTMATTLSYSMSLGVARPAPGDNSETVNQTANLGWVISPTLSSRYYISDNRRLASGSQNSIARNYGAGLSLAPLDTVLVDLGVNRAEYFLNGSRTTETNSAVLGATADLYRDLNSRLNVSYSETGNPRSQTQSRAFTTLLGATARFNPRLTVDLSEGYNNTWSSGSGTVTTLETRTSLAWRLSDLTSLRMSGFYTISDPGDNSGRFNTDLAMKLTRTMQMRAGYNILVAAETTQLLNLGWDWSISRQLSLHATGNYQIREGDDPWSVISRLNMNFSNRN
ncbi:MAG: hypothetical protein L3J03_10575 [Desulfobacterales bacterium]|nr:hypothetical protein [Desulfobacterales bacterium]